MIHEEIFRKQVEGAILGSVVGDALGVPGEFMSRKELALNPITTMRSGGAHGQLAGTWSDDTSMVLCTVVSIIEHGIDFDDQMSRFADWLWDAKYTARGEVFDVGGATKQSIFRFIKKTPALECGEESEFSCGNGSLMRLLPTALYIIKQYGNSTLDDRAAEIIHNTSRCTHAHPRCQMACGILFSVIAAITQGGNKKDCIERGIYSGLEYYRDLPTFKEVYADFTFLTDISLWHEEQVKSSGYVIDTLQAALWCFYTTSSYAECVLRAVNLGEDTDTTAAVAGAVAGLWYGEGGIPKEWQKETAKYLEIKALCERFLL